MGFSTYFIRFFPFAKILVKVTFGQLKKLKTMDTKKLIKRLIVCIGTCYVLSSCGTYSPIVHNRFIKKYPPTTPDSVKIFKPGETVPNSSEVIGVIAIRDSIQYYNLTDINGFNLIKKKAAEYGGNGFAITTYVTPSYFNKFYEEIQGTVLHFTDTNIYTNLPNPSMDIVSSSYRSEQYVLKPSNLPINTFSLHFGIGQLNLATDLMGRDSNFETGTELEIKYERIIGSWFGIGIQYSAFHANNSFGDLSINYFAPTLVAKGGYDNFFITTNVGIGYLGYKENSKVKNSNNNSDFPQFNNSSISKIPLYIKSGWGFNADISLEYKLSKHFGVSGKFGGIVGYIHNNDIPDVNRRKLTYARINTLLGLKVYF